MLKLPKVTLVALTSVNIEATIKALKYSSKDIEFGDVKIITDVNLSNFDLDIKCEYIEKITSIDAWNYAAIYLLPKYIETEYCILIHADGFIVNANLWKDEFLEYDYIGAPWPLPNDKFSYRDIDNNLIRVGNSVSLRSKKLMDLPILKNLEWKSFHGYYNEDGFICVNYRHEYLKEGLKFAPIEVAKYFSKENEILENNNIEPFAFHRYNGSNSKYPKF